MPPKKVHLTHNWILELDGIERVRFETCDIPDEIMDDIVVHESATMYPQRLPADPPQVDVRVEGPAFTDTSVEELWDRTGNYVGGGHEPLEGMYFSGTLYQLDVDKKTKIKRWDFFEMYCGGRVHGTFSAAEKAVRKEGFILRPRKLKPAKM